MLAQLGCEWLRVLRVFSRSAGLVSGGMSREAERDWMPINFFSIMKNEMLVGARQSRSLIRSQAFSEANLRNCCSRTSQPGR